MPDDLKTMRDTAAKNAIEEQTAKVIKARGPDYLPPLEPTHKPEEAVKETKAAMDAWQDTPEGGVTTYNLSRSSWLRPQETGALDAEVYSPRPPPDGWVIHEGGDRLPTMKAKGIPQAWSAAGIKTTKKLSLDYPVHHIEGQYIGIPGGSGSVKGVTEKRFPDGGAIIRITEGGQPGFDFLYYHPDENFMYYVRPRLS